MARFHEFTMDTITGEARYEPGVAPEQIGDDLANHL